MITVFLNPHKTSAASLILTVMPQDQMNKTIAIAKKKKSDQILATEKIEGYQKQLIWMPCRDEKMAVFFPNRNSWKGGR